MDKDLRTVVNSVPEIDCTGCSSCSNACPQGALSMSENSIGHLFPILSRCLCVNCGLCLKTCPSLVPQIGNRPKQVFAVWAKDIGEHQSSTSGGVASVIARSIINEGGIVFGSAFVKNKGIIHISIEDELSINRLKGSKYAQSVVGNSYKEVKKHLLNGQKVCFIGTPCQVAGLKHYLYKPYNSLVTIDLVCHGVPPQKLLFEHLSHKGISFEDIDNIQFRSQNTPQYRLTVYDDKGAIYSKTIFEDLYYAAFNDCLTFRESCINCRYSNASRIGDITLGDFHGLGADVPFLDKANGNISLVLVNTEIGDRIINNCVTNLEIFERSLQEAQSHNPQLREPAHRRANYKRFLKLYNRYGFEKAANAILWKRHIKNMIIKLKDCIQK